MKLSTQVGELVIPPYLLQAEFLAFLLIPHVIEVERTGILASVGLFLRLHRLQRGRLGGLRSGGLLLGLVEFGSRDEHRQLCESILRGLIARFDQHLGVIVRIGIIRDFAQLERVLVAVVGDDVDVGRSICCLRLHADKARSHMAPIEDPIHGIAGENVGYFLLGRKHDQSGLQ